MLRFLDATGLTDVFHTHWFIALLVLVSLCIVAASIQRFPNSWRYFARPYKSPDEGFRKVLPTQAQIPIADDEQGLSAAERAFKHLHLKTERIVRTDSFSVFSERNRISEMAVYMVHASLLLIFMGYGVVDALYGWRGFLVLSPGTASNQIEMKDGAKRTIPFAIRCDGTGEETYADGMPEDAGGRSLRWSRADARCRAKKSWSTILWSIRECASTRPAMAAPASSINSFSMRLQPTAQARRRKFPCAMNQTVALDADTSVQLVEFIPDFVVQDGRVYARSNDVVNPAVHMIVTSKKAKSSVNVWLPQMPGIDRERVLPLHFRSQGSEDRPLHRIAGLARTRPVGGVGWSGADGDRPDLCFLRGAHAFLGGSRRRCARPNCAVDRRHRKPQSRCLRT